MPGINVLGDVMKVSKAVGDQVIGWATGNEEEMKKAKPLGKILRATPVLSQVPVVMSLFSQDIAKELSYQLPSADNPPDYSNN
jgi:hypothetical protein